MDVSGILGLAGQFGPMGLLVAYLVWREMRDEKRRIEEADRRAAIDEKDILSREKLAVALTSLAMVIQGRPSV